MKQKDRAISSYRKAYYDYEVIDSIEAGIVLLGYEVKSLKNNGASLEDNYCVIERNGVFMKNLKISKYKFTNDVTQDLNRDRKLLLHLSEINKLRKYTNVKGYTLLVLSIYLKHGIIKVKLGVCKGRKKRDKRRYEKEKEISKEIRSHL